jgi:hypothetical protein
MDKWTGFLEYPCSSTVITQSYVSCTQWYSFHVLSAYVSIYEICEYTKFHNFSRKISFPSSLHQAGHAFLCMLWWFWLSPLSTHPNPLSEWQGERGGGIRWSQCVYRVVDHLEMRGGTLGTWGEPDFISTDDHYCGMQNGFLILFTWLGLKSTSSLIPPTGWVCLI